jgi:DNA-binding CsgD family transcriptional regulator
MRILFISDHTQQIEDLKTKLDHNNEFHFETSFDQKYIKRIWQERQPNILIVAITQLLQESIIDLIKFLKVHFQFRMICIYNEFELKLLHRFLNVSRPDAILIHPVTKPQLMATLHLIQLGQQEESKKPSTSHLDVLSKREREVWEWIRKGLTSKEIAGQLFVSVNTVNTHKRRIREKLRVRRFVEVG